MVPGMSGRGAKATAKASGGRGGRGRAGRGSPLAADAITDFWRTAAASGVPERTRLRRLGFALDEVSWVRPANATLPMTAQLVPRRVMQMGLTFSRAADRHIVHMRKWWALNPEYEYRFFTDAQCSSYVDAHATPDELRAYRTVVLGAQRRSARQCRAWTPRNLKLAHVLLHTPSRTLRRGLPLR